MIDCLLKVSHSEHSITYKARKPKELNMIFTTMHTWCCVLKDMKKRVVPNFRSLTLTRKGAQAKSGVLGSLLVVAETKSSPRGLKKLASTYHMHGNQ